MCILVEGQDTESKPDRKDCSPYSTVGCAFCPLVQFPFPLVGNGALPVTRKIGARKFQRWPANVKSQYSPWKFISRANDCQTKIAPSDA